MSNPIKRTQTLTTGKFEWEFGDKAPTPNLVNEDEVIDEILIKFGQNLGVSLGISDAGKTIEAQTYALKSQAEAHQSFKALLDEREKKAEERILDEKMGAITEMIHKFIDDRAEYSWKPAKIKANHPLDYDPLVRQIRDFASDNSGGGRILCRAIAAADKAIAAIDKKQAQLSQSKEGE